MAGGAHVGRVDVSPRSAEMQERTGLDALAPSLPNELSGEVERIRGLYLSRPFPEFLLLMADDVWKLRRALRAARGGR